MSGRLLGSNRARLGKLMTEDTKSNLNKGYFLLIWILACACGSWISAPLGVISGEKIGFQIGHMVASNFAVGTQTVIVSVIAGMLNGAVSSALFSFSQWFVLRKYLSRASLWIPFSMLGAVTSSALGSFAISRFDSFAGNLRNTFYLLVIGGIVLSPVSGLIAGFFEWMVLRRQLSRATNWIWARTASGIVGAIALAPAVSIGFASHNEYIRLFMNSSVGLVGGIIFGTITGFTLYSLIKDSAQIDRVHS
jgi:MFS family permease